MIIKFTARTMQAYKGNNGLGQIVELAKDQTAEVSDSVGKLLCQKYHHNFQEIKEETKVELPSKSDKKQRKVSNYRSK